MNASNAERTSGFWRQAPKAMCLVLAAAAPGCGMSSGRNQPETQDAKGTAASRLSTCNPAAWVYMGDNASACEGHEGESCGWTAADEGQGYHCQATSWGMGCEPGGLTCPGGGGGSSNGTKPTGGACDASAWVYMGDNANACDGHVGESCGWTSTDQGQGYHCQGTSWGTGCEPGGQTCPGGGGGSSNGTKPTGGTCDASAWVYMGDNASACDGHVGESCGWTSANEGQGYHCQATSWGTGCEPGGQACTGGSSGSGGTSGTGGTGSGGAPADTGFSTAPQGGLLPSQEADQLAVQVANALMRDFGLSKVQAAGVLGNLYFESAGMNANMNQEYQFDGRGGPGAPSADMNQGYGWAQWSYGRKSAFLAYSAQQGLDPASPAANYAYLKYELQNDQAGTVPALRATGTPDDAARTFCSVFEGAEIPNVSGRLDQANRINGLL